MKKLFIIFLFIVSFTALLSQNQQANIYKTSIWENNQISVCWDNPNEANKEMRELVRRAIKETWEKNSGVQFTDWVSAAEKDADIHIFISDEGPHTKGLGNQLKNKKKGMVLNFAFNTWSKGCRFGRKELCIKAIAVHEFGHALGFAHEQNRTECKFPDCLGQEQGMNGDWFIPQCDLNSIMNYCSPDWNNCPLQANWDNCGLLSELDIQAAQYFYGPPPNKINEFPELQLVHTSNQIAAIKGKKISHEFKIYIVGIDSELNNIEKVVYKLHPTFKNPNMTNSLRKSNFGISLKVWGEFEVSADVYKKDGTVITLNRFLDFDGNGIEGD